MENYIDNFLDVYGPATHVNHFVDLFKRNEVPNTVDLKINYSDDQTCELTFQTKYDPPIKMLRRYKRNFPNITFELQVVDDECLSIGEDGRYLSGYVDARTIKI